MTKTILLCIFILVKILLMAASKRPSLSSSSSSSPYTSSTIPSLPELLQKFHSIVKKIKQSHVNDMEMLHHKIKDLESDNRHLRLLQEQHPHSIFDIDYVSNDASSVNQLKSELERAQKQIDVLQESINQQYSEYEEIKGKYTLQRSMNENYVEQQTLNNDSNKVKELELKFQQIKDQINQFDQCNYESDEQIRLLKQLISTNDQPPKTITQSLTVKQSDLEQQTSLVENLLNKQHDTILSKIAELFDQNPRSEQQTTTTKNKKTKKKRL
jgi:hypothetical protein